MVITSLINLTIGNIIAPDPVWEEEERKKVESGEKLTLSDAIGRLKMIFSFVGTNEMKPGNDFVTVCYNCDILVPTLDWEILLQFVNLPYICFPISLSLVLVFEQKVSILLQTKLS